MEDKDLTYPFPSFVKRTVERSDPFEISGDGNRCATSSTSTDVVAPSLKAVELGIQEPVNLGWGRPTAFNQAGKDPKCQHSGTRCSVEVLFTSWHGVFTWSPFLELSLHR
jgi:hypothetical protein